MTQSPAAHPLCSGREHLAAGRGPGGGRLARRERRALLHRAQEPALVTPRNPPSQLRRPTVPPKPRLTEAHFPQIFTKVDKKRKVRPGKRSNALENVEEFLFELGQTWTEFPPMVLTSSSSAAGKQELGNHIAFLRNRWKKGGMRRSVKPPTGKAGAAKGGAATGAEKSPAGDDEDDF